MDLPESTQWTAGTLITDELFNEASEAYTFLLGPPMAEVRRTTNQTIASYAYGTWTPVTFDTLVQDNDSMWSAGSPTRLTIETPGWYEVEYQVRWADSGSITYRGGGVVMNGARDSASVLGYHDFINQTSVQTIRVAFDHFFTVADYVELVVWQVTGGNLDLACSNGYDTCTSLRVQWSSM